MTPASKAQDPPLPAVPDDKCAACRCEGDCCDFAVFTLRDDGYRSWTCGRCGHVWLERIDRTDPATT